jgi:hypothetical protein
LARYFEKKREKRVRLKQRLKGPISGDENDGDYERVFEGNGQQDHQDPRPVCENGGQFQKRRATANS